MIGRPNGTVKTENLVGSHASHRNLMVSTDRSAAGGPGRASATARMNADGDRLEGDRDEEEPRAGECPPGDHVLVG